MFHVLPRFVHHYCPFGKLHHSLQDLIEEFPHLVCTICVRITEVSLSSLTAVSFPLRARVSYVTRHEVLMMGILRVISLSASYVHFLQRCTNRFRFECIFFSRASFMLDCALFESFFFTTRKEKNKATLRLHEWLLVQDSCLIGFLYGNYCVWLVWPCHGSLVLFSNFWKEQTQRTNADVLAQIRHSC